MKKTNFDFPHPVLFEGNDDYINSTFSIATEDVSEDGQDFRLQITYTLTSNGLNELISKNKAAVVVKIESSFASYRRIEIFDCDKTQKEISIKRNLVAKELVITAQIVANEKLDDFLLYLKLYAFSTNLCKKKGIQAVLSARQAPGSKQNLEVIDALSREFTNSSYFYRKYMVYCR